MRKQKPKARPTCNLELQSNQLQNVLGKEYENIRKKSVEIEEEVKKPVSRP